MDLTPFTPMKLLRHSDKIAAMLKGDITYPISVEIDLSNVCPHDCPFCSFGTSESHGYRQQNWVTFPVPRIFTLLDELADCGVKSVTFTGGGEPLVHRHAAAIFEHATSLGLQWGLVTNGLLLKGPIVGVIATGATFVRVSLDAGTAETHQFTHGTKVPQFHQILSNIAALRAASGDRLTIGASFCVMDQNYKEIYAGAKAAKDAGANYLEVRPTFPTDWRGDGWGSALADDHIDAAKTEIEHARLHLNDNRFQVIGMVHRFDALTETVKPFKACHIGPITAVIGATGELWHCCVQRGQAFFRMGDVLASGFREAWHLALQRRMVEQIDVSKCPRCRYAGFNTLIEQAFMDDRLHANFI